MERSAGANYLRIFAEEWINVAIVTNGVIEVCHRGRVNGRNPHGVDAQIN
ncbi:hypothetical protein ACPOL_0858 [Acidisarcina polymorpha]|uniref:Uncharacterized protein n=1 Tax=Acidisarcina polymorpha TaxID=2211140 RepID=A0A2Z5FV37_9BACT|nr:hypothetical protein ACPOL_0858 [Acidisarcina polymorpha]